MRVKLFIPRLFVFGLVALLVSGCQMQSDALQPPPAPDPETALAEPDPVTHAVDAEKAVPARTTTAATRTLQQRLDDASAEARVIHALAKQSQLRIFDFHPTVKDGRLTLSGDVNTSEQHRVLERVLARVDGVHSVNNQVTVAGQSVAEARQMIADAGGDTESKGAYYTVRSGDTLWKIARRHRASVERIKDLNEIRGTSLQPGQRIRVR
ncbi:LysM peptidoglycan-binding domain-containing protein [Longibacter salinarum]|nr:LysM peptidoglycan-binding domain-containing protein [Longibacter salinarum]